MVLLLFLFTATQTWADYKSYDVKKSETVQKELSFPNSSAPGTLTIDNIFGSIHAEGYNGKTIKLTAEKITMAKSQGKLAQALKEVKLDVSTAKNDISVMVDGPFRTKDDCICWNSKKMGYVVKYNFKLKIPRNASIILKTVNEGEIEVKGINGKCKLNNVNDHIDVNDLTGDFEIHTVNGPIRIDRVTGSGDAHTVNGPVTVNFVKNPPKDCSFKTINGKLKINFQKGLSADFKIKTFNGKIYSDFPSSYLPQSPGKGERKGGKYIYKSDGFQGIRIGNGGPKIKMDTLNGNIYIAEAN